MYRYQRPLKMASTVYVRETKKNELWARQSDYLFMQLKILSNFFFLFSIAEKKKLELAEKFKKLKSSGKLEQYLKKKGKKVAGKERKKMPQRRVVMET